MLFSRSTSYYSSVQTLLNAYLIRSEHVPEELGSILRLRQLRKQRFGEVQARGGRRGPGGKRRNGGPAPEGGRRASALRRIMDRTTKEVLTSRSINYQNTHSFYVNQ